MLSNKKEGITIREYLLSHVILIAYNHKVNDTMSSSVK